MIDTDKYEGHTEGPWRTAEGQPYDDEGSHLDIEGANGVLVTETSYFTDDDHPNVQLMADAPLLLEEYVRVTQALRYVGVSMYLDKNNYRHYDYSDMLDYIMEITGEPDDLSGQMGAMIQDVIEE